MIQMTRNVDKTFQQRFCDDQIAEARSKLANHGTSRMVAKTRKLARIPNSPGYRLVLESR